MYGYRYYSIATQPADYHDYLIYVCLLFKKIPIGPNDSNRIYIHSVTAYDLDPLHTPNICYKLIITVIMAIRTLYDVHK